MIVKRLTAIAALLACTALSAYAQPRVVGVTDGDTLTVYDQKTNVKTKIRISAIDSPEKKQAFGQAAAAQRNRDEIEREADKRKMRLYHVSTASDGAEQLKKIAA